VERLHAVQRASTDLASADQLEHRLGLDAGYPQVVLGVAKHLLGPEPCMRLACGPERQLRTVHPSRQSKTSHGRGQGLISKQRPQLAGRELALLQVPGGEREREVEADDQVRVPIRLGDQQLDALGAGPATFEPNQFTSDYLGQPERSPLVGAASPRPVDSDEARIGHAGRLRP
jgi:hypothetical protein